MNIIKVKIVNDGGHDILKQIVDWLENRFGFNQFSIENYSNNSFQILRDHSYFEYAYVLMHDNDIAVEFKLRFL